MPPIRYGWTISNPQWVCRIYADPLTWQQCARALLHDVLSLVFEAALFAGSVTCFAYSFGAFR